MYTCVCVCANVFQFSPWNAEIRTMHETVYNGIKAAVFILGWFKWFSDTEEFTVKYSVATLTKGLFIII